MTDSKKSSSIEQVKAEDIIFSLVEQKLGVLLEKNPMLYFSINKYSYIQPDFYSAQEQIVGEIFAHIGKPKKAQNNKIANDILKMLLLDKISKTVHRKILVVCDKEELKALQGQSALSESIRQFGIEVLLVEIDDKIKQQIMDAQDRQKMINA